ncbi:G-protein coupled receptor 171 isoform X2 [Misgurnus anguillicaudatus]|uniref:G-protein coupled receptor 171 isoform X2 n=1 Tax=Misgurnus anguillicaudatus TaxID=75329 RepID=UPI002435B8C8|nr:G-protein coupled receptor 171 isoform X2 [Misgurnus anguillicaudatus]
MESANHSTCVINDKMVPFATFYIIIFLIGITTSLVALWAFITSKSAKKCINVYLINLLLSDFLLMMALPVKIANDLGNVSQSLMVFHCQEVSFAVLMSAVVWFLILFINVPNMAIPMNNITVKQGVTCSDLKTEMGKHWHALSVFLGMAIFFNASAAVLLSNGLVLKQLWGRRETDPEDQASARHAFRNIALVTLAYVICFVPYHAVRMPYTFTQVTELITDCDLKKSLFLAKESTLLLAILHLCFDPLLYFIICRAFRDRVTKAFLKRPSIPDDADTQIPE